MPNEKLITLRRLEPGEVPRDGDFYMQRPWSRDAGATYREVSPIPEGFEVCDLEGATKVLIGETWCERSGSYFILNDAACPLSTLAELGVLAIRPIPEPEPMRGEAKVCENRKWDDSGVVHMPVELIGKRIRWEVVKDGGE